MVELVHQGGPTMFMILALVVPGLVLAILHVVFRATWSLWVSAAVVALILAIGLYGRHQGRTLTDRAVEEMAGGDSEEMRAEGYLESNRPLQLAVVVDSVLLIGIVIGELRRRRRRT